MTDDQLIATLRRAWDEIADDYLRLEEGMTMTGVEVAEVTADYVMDPDASRQLCTMSTDAFNALAVKAFPAPAYSA